MNVPVWSRRQDQVLQRSRRATTSSEHSPSPVAHAFNAYRASPISAVRVIHTLLMERCLTARRDLRTVRGIAFITCYSSPVFPPIVLSLRPVSFLYQRICLWTRLACWAVVSPQAGAAWRTS